MINLKITEESQKKLYDEMQNKINGSKELTSSKTRQELTNAIFSVSSIKFIKTTNLRARSAASSFHHVYEWNKVGQESGRLFRLLKTNNSYGASIYYKFINSKKVVPLPKEISRPGNTGKKVGKSKIFKRKAEVMESGKPVQFITRKTIVFSDKGRLVFIPPGKTVNILNPGGKQTNNSFSKHFMTWWMTMPAQIAEETGIFKSLENSVARALDVTYAGPQQASLAISKTLNSYEVVGSVI